MTVGSVLRAMAQLAAAYAVVGVIGTMVLALLSGGLDANGLLPLVVLAVALGFAAVVIVFLARLVVSWLDGRVGDPVDLAIMFVSGLVLLSGALTIASLGLSGLLVAALLALATHAVLTRNWA
ncbi:hypothetical protein H9L21_03235 [Aeromicrobium senzhongii]|uniref:Uncharacterized protein n=1 Tax=Aeromicrobium senzhongii TaxID=2663859 RepID=A0ABX6SWL8_9ACTN|nr:hypothetical protein [Aeromicrobium senzhongii]MTB88014.1 hypothetical protein [Aeromicrobium senzhongii]QNL94977.1 hypothetical protein H9L21_03235 [Aeromicrobium senzhongii]